MYGVTKISTAENIMLAGVAGIKPLVMIQILEELAAAGVVVDMISQTAPVGSVLSFSFTSGQDFMDIVVKTIASACHGHKPAPMISTGYSKLNLFGEEMVESVGVAARALVALSAYNIEAAMLTTSDLDISILVRSEEEDTACKALCTAFQL